MKILTMLEQPFSLRQDKYLRFFIFKLLLFGNLLVYITFCYHALRNDTENKMILQKHNVLARAEWLFFFFPLVFPGNIDILGPFPTWKFQSDLLSPFVQLQHRIIILEELMINLLIHFYSILGVHQALALPVSQDWSHLRRFLPLLKPTRSICCSRRWHCCRLIHQSEIVNKRALQVAPIDLASGIWKENLLLLQSHLSPGARGCVSPWVEAGTSFQVSDRCGYFPRAGEGGSDSGN